MLNDRSSYGGREINLVVVHCSATPPTMDIGAQEIDQWHRNRKYLGNGYHVVIRRDGTAETSLRGNKCRPLKKAGAHAYKFNRNSIGICLVGGIDAQGEPENNFAPEQFESLKDVLRDIREAFPVTQIKGHRDLPNVAKDCPSFDVSEWLQTVA